MYLSKCCALTQNLFCSRFVNALWHLCPAVIVPIWIVSGRSLRKNSFRNPMYVTPLIGILPLTIACLLQILNLSLHLLNMQLSLFPIKADYSQTIVIFSLKLKSDLMFLCFQGQCQDCKVGGPNLWACLEVRKIIAQSEKIHLSTFKLYVYGIFHYS